MMKTSEILQGAREKLSHGWVQRAMISPEGYCMMGAVAFTAMGDERCDEQIYEVRDLLRTKILEMYPDIPEYRVDTFGAIAGFNDDFRRTKDEVLAVMDKAILSCQERGE